MFNINFDKTTRTKNGFPGATVHLERPTKSNCRPQSKRPEQGHWETWSDLPSEETHLERHEISSTVKGKAVCKIDNTAFASSK